MEFVMEQALERGDVVKALLERWDMPRGTEVVPLAQAYGRVTACACNARFNLPVHRVSSLDGFAVRSADFANGTPDTTAWTAGVDYATADTGDDFPDGFDTVIAVENVTFDERGAFHLDPAFTFKPGSAVRAAGSQLQAGELLCEAGTLLRPEDVALLAAGGYADVEVRRRVRVGYLPTGNELVDVGTTPQRGQNVQSNALMIRGFVQSWGGEFVEHGIVPDDRAELGLAIDRLLASCDIVLVNGGSSRGSEDYNSQLLQERATYFSHGVRAVPGRPIGISIIGGKPAINIPGPMMAAWLACDWLLRSLLDACNQQTAKPRATIEATASERIAARPGFEYLARLVATTKDGCWQVAPLQRGATLAKNVRGVNAWCAVPAGTAFEPGDKLAVGFLGTCAPPLP